MNTPPRQVQLLHAPGCPRTQELRALIEECLRELGLPGGVEQVVGHYPSPTGLVDGVDVLTGRPAGVGASCRLDLPTPGQIRNALGTSLVLRLSS